MSTWWVDVDTVLLGNNDENREEMLGMEGGIREIKVMVSMGCHKDESV